MADCKRKTANLFDTATVEKGRIDNGEVGYDSQTSSLTIEGGTVSFTTTAAYRGVCSGFFEIPEGTETITFNFIRNEALGVKFVFYDSNKTWLNADVTPQLIDIPPATANIPSGAKYVRISFTGQITGGYSYTMSNIMLNTGSQPLPYEPYGWLHSLRKLGTSTDTLTTLPVDLYADGNNATVGLKGNMSQTGTPTPSSPIQPSECGEMTGNLINVQPFTIESDSVSHNVVLWSGTLPIGTYTISLNQDDNMTSALRNTLRLIIGSTVYYESANENYHLQSGQHKMTFTISDSSQNVEIRYWGNTLGNECSYSNIMLNLGSTPLPYEPYGYKIPISSANTTTPVYLGEVETVRQIKKTIVNITNIITLSNGNKAGLFAFSDSSEYAIQQYGLCDIAEYDIARRTTGMFYVNRQNAIFIGDSNDTLDTLKAIYDGCTLWYVLETPETAVVNEPLRKIGDYADTVSGITIPTITGKDTFDVETTLKPSEVELTYTGWHDASVKEWVGSEWE